MVKHIGFIMDGNRRYSVENGLKKSDGYKLGLNQFINFVKYQIKYGIFETSFFALSTDNYEKRGILEKKILYSLIKSFYEDKSLEEFFKLNKIQINIKGDLEEIKLNEKNLPKSERMFINELIDKFENWNKKLTRIKFKVNICLNYDGQREIVYAIQNICEKIVKGDIDVSDINEDIIKQNIYFNDSFAPEIIVRPGDAPRLSGFMLWDSKYSEIYLTKKLWPALTEEDFVEILDWYSRIKRNFGK